MNEPQQLWDFAVAFYAQPQVADTCVRVQDEYKANVCLLIAMCWLDTCSQPLSDAEFARLKTHIAGWTIQIVEPLRSLRRQLKLPFEALPQDETQEQLRNALKQAELLAEKKLLEELERWLSESANAVDKKVVSNLERYAQELNLPPAFVAVFSRS